MNEIFGKKYNDKLEFIETELMEINLNMDS